jgi:hypothetical protein
MHWRPVHGSQRRHGRLGHQLESRAMSMRSADAAGSIRRASDIGWSLGLGRGHGTINIDRAGRGDGMTLSGATLSRDRPLAGI